MEQTALTVASILATTPAIRTARPLIRIPLTLRDVPPVPQMDAATSHVIIINPAARLMVMKADVIAIHVPMDAAVLENAVVPAPNQNAPDRLTVWSFILVKAQIVVGNMTANTILPVTIVKPNIELAFNIPAMTVHWTNA